MDKTPPRNRLIALYTALAVVTLLGLKPAFDAYFDRMHISALAQGIEQGFVEATVVGEPGSQARLAAAGALEGRTDALRRCYDERVAERPGLVGSLEARVRSDNGVVSVRLEGEGIDDPALMDCVRTALESLAGLPPTEVRLRIAFAPTDADAAKQQWRDALATGPMTIDDAMARLGRQGRMAFPQIRPQRAGEMNLDALRGWAQLPQELPDVVQQRQDAQGAAPAEGVTPAEGAAPGEGAAPAEGAPAAGGAVAGAAPAPGEGSPTPAPAAPAPAPAEEAPTPQE